MFSKSTIKYIQSLQHKKFRDEYKVFVAEGPKVVTELLKANKFACKAVYALQDWVDGLDRSLSALAGVTIDVIKDFELEKIAAYSSANKVVAVFGKRAPVEKPSLKNKFTLVLDDIQDPGNLGTIIRTADWFGIQNVICSNSTVDIYNSKVVQSTMASLGNVNVLYTDIEQWLAEHDDIPRFAAVLDGRPLGEFKNAKEGLLIIGNESKGISDPVMQLANEKITIPRIGSAESLNAGVATGILLYGLVNN